VEGKWLCTAGVETAGVEYDRKGALVEDVVDLGKSGSGVG
jgi:hypothetical protein